MGGEEGGGQGLEIFGHLKVDVLLGVVIELVSVCFFLLGDDLLEH